jgi:septum formation protein
LPLVLASASDRRWRILREAGYAFETRDPGDVEGRVASGADPEALAIAKASAKAEAVAAAWLGRRRGVIVGADTLVALGGDVIEKPADRADAARILGRLSATRHRVITGICLRLTPGTRDPIVAAEATWVTMRPMSPGEIQAYVSSGEADGKAGAYAVQETGDRFVERIDGSFLNVVGFPLERFRRLLPRALAEWGVV